MKLMNSSKNKLNNKKAAFFQHIPNATLKLIIVEAITNIL